VSRRSPALRALALGIAVSLAVALLSRVGVFQGWETWAVDQFLFWRDSGRSSPAIVLVEIDEDAFQFLCERQPIPRGYLVDLARMLLASGAAAVVFDIQFSAPTTAEDDAALLDLIGREGSRLVFASAARPVLGPADGVVGYAPVPGFSPALDRQLGFANAPLGRDHMVRAMFPLLRAPDGGYLPSLAVLALAAAAGQSPSDATEALRRGQPLRLPGRHQQLGRAGAESVAPSSLDTGNWRIDYAGPAAEPPRAPRGAAAGPCDPLRPPPPRPDDDDPRRREQTFTAFPSNPLVAEARRGATPASPNPFEGKVVLVGATFRESRDFLPTPVGFMAGMEIQANMIHTLLARRALRPPPIWLSLSLLIGVCVLVALASVWLRPLWVLVASGALVAVLTVASYEAFARGGYWLDFVGPLAGMLAYLQGARMVERRRLRRAFGEFVSPEIMRQVLAEGAELGGKNRVVSVLMSDLRGFTTLSERLPPAVVSETINEYFTAMVEVIMSHRGMVQDFIGDGILAVFGAPLDDPEHAWNAVSAAEGMRRALEGLNAGWRAQGRAELALGAAVHTGEVFAGYLGAPRKKKYAALGDTVNTTSRVEGLNKELGTTILMTAETAAAVAGRVSVRDRGAVRVKGREAPVQVFELVALGAHVAEPEAAGTGGER
jgi:adenylate cyclase